MIPDGVRIFVCTEAVDMRYGFDRLAATARERVGEDPQQGGALFAFCNKRADRMKILWLDRNGYVLLYKRLSGAFFDLPTGASGSVRIEASALGKLLAGVERERRRKRRRTRTAVACISLEQRRTSIAARARDLADYGP